jgi:hypothetical protein
MTQNEDKNQPLEALLGIGEIAADIYKVGGDTFSGVPVIGSMFSLIKTANTIRDKALAVKPQKLLAPIYGSSPEYQAKFREKLLRDTDETSRVGSILFLVVERLVELDKAQLLGILFRAYLLDKLKSVDFRRLAQAIDLGFGDDLKMLIDSQEDPAQSKEIWLRSLVGPGLAEVVAGKTWSDNGEIYYQVSDLGRTLRHAYIAGKNTC